MITDLQVKTRTCDECGNVVSDEGMHSGFPGFEFWKGWSAVIAESYRTVFGRKIEEERRWDFCCDDCLTKWVIDRSKL